MRAAAGALERGERNLSPQTLVRFATLVEVRAVRLLPDDFSVTSCQIVDGGSPARGRVR